MAMRLDRRRTGAPPPPDPPTPTTTLSSTRKRPRPKAPIQAIAVVVLLGLCILYWTVLHSLTQLQTSPTASQPNEEPLLALVYPPGLMGGYRNQVIRFISLVEYARTHQIPQLLLPSILWATQIGDSADATNSQWVPIPMELIFDIDYWNTFAPELPKLIQDAQPYDCWTPRSTPYGTTVNEHIQGFATPIANYSIAVAKGDLSVNPRKLDLLPQLEHCRRPQFYGGGKSAGRLWNDYMELHQGGKRPQVDALVNRALRPNHQWRTLAESCSIQPDYVALHARIELEMMDHNCGKDMEFNLTRILGFVQDRLAPTRLFVAVSRQGIQVQDGRLYNKYQTMADYNLATLNRHVASSKVFECGEHLLDQYYQQHADSLDYGSLLQSVVNFYIATQATAFVGVRGSSYSTDIWITRYYQGKGLSNYEYTPEGILPVENGGLPPPHQTCARPKKKK